MRNFFLKLIKNIKRCFLWRNFRWHLLAIVLTYIIVMSGFDWKYFVFMDRFSQFAWFFPAMVLGGLFPIFLPIIFFIFGKIRRSESLVVTALSLVQAAIIGSLVSSFYKAFTGRIHPPAHFGSEIMSRAALADISHGFHFGFWRGGIFWGWPSSHTTIAFAMAFALVMLYPKNKIIRYGAISYALYVGISVSVSIHWFSEFVAGAIVGTVIGIVVGRSFANKVSIIQEKSQA